MRKLLLIIILIIIAFYVFVRGIPDPIVNWVNDHKATTEEEYESEDMSDDTDSDSGNNSDGYLTSTMDIGLTNYDGMGAKYYFTYKGEEFRALYQNDCWTVYDSYKITNKHDIKIICQALIDVHPVHGKDMSSYRTADDMAYEWRQHNIAYKYLPDDSSWKDDACNVDLDPYDQGRSFEEIYEDRTGEQFSIKEEIKESLEDGTFFDKAKRFFQ